MPVGREGWGFESLSLSEKTSVNRVSNVPAPRPVHTLQHTKLINETQSISKLRYEVTATIGHSVFPEPTERAGMSLTYFNCKQNLLPLEKAGNHPAGASPAF